MSILKVFKTILAFIVLASCHMYSMVFLPKNDLERAILSNKPQEVQSLIECKKFEVNQLNSEGISPLAFAVLWHKPERLNLMSIIMSLISMGADTHWADEKGISLLMVASVEAKELSLLSYLMKMQNTYIGHRSKNGETVLDYLKYYVHVREQDLLDTQKNIQKLPTEEKDELCKQIKLEMYTMREQALQNDIANAHKVESYLQPFFEQHEKDQAKTEKNKHQFAMLTQSLKNRCFSDLRLQFSE